MGVLILVFIISGWDRFRDLLAKAEGTASSSLQYSVVSVALVKWIATNVYWALTCI